MTLSSALRIKNKTGDIWDNIPQSNILKQRIKCIIRKGGVEGGVMEQCPHNIPLRNILKQTTKVQSRQWVMGQFPSSTQGLCIHRVENWPKISQELSHLIQY